MIPACAESWSVSDDGLVYTFNIRKGASWSTSEGTVYAEVKAKDFEAGFHHMLDAQAGLEWLVEGVIEGVSEYLYGGGKWDAVGYKAVDDYTLQVTLCAPTSYFMTMLTYSCCILLNSEDSAVCEVEALADRCEAAVGEHCHEVACRCAKSDLQCVVVNSLVSDCIPLSAAIEVL